jgi:hypothetical protein
MGRAQTYYAGCANSRRKSVAFRMPGAWERLYLLANRFQGNKRGF